MTSECHPNTLREIKIDVALFFYIKLTMIQYAANNYLKLTALENNLQNLHLEKFYLDFVSEIKKKYQSAQLKAAYSVSTEVINFYW